MSYSGWVNWETWNTVNWHGDALQEIVNAAETEDEAEKAVEDYLSTIFEDAQGNVDGLLADFLSESQSNIHIWEIVSTLWEDREDD